MSKIFTFYKSRGPLSVVLSVVLSVIFVVTIVEAATTISTNIETGGTLSVTGASTLTGNTTVGGTLGVTGLTSLGQASSTRFSVFDTAYFGGTATSSFSSAGVLSLVSNGLSVGANELVVSGGNVGIGAAPSTNALLVQKDQNAESSLQLINSTDSSSAAARIAVSVGGASANDPYFMWGMLDASRSYALGIRNSDSDKLVLTTAASNTTNLSDTRLLTIQTDGNVGIGTSTPNTRLHVSEGASATTTVTVGELGLTTSKACVNMNQADGSAGSFYIVGDAIVVESNYCR